MKLAAKLVLLFLCCLALVVAVFSALSMRQIHQLALAEHERHAADLATTLQAALRQSPRPADDIDTVLRIWSQELRHVRVRVVSPDPSLGASRQPSVPIDMVLSRSTLSTIVYPDEAGQQTMYTYVPLEGGNKRLEIAAPESYWAERLAGTLWNSSIALIAVSSVTSLAILLGGLWMVGRPLEQLVEKVQRVGRGDLTGPVEVQRGDELGRLGTAINEMCEQLNLQRQQVATETSKRLSAVEQLRHADRLRTVGRLAAGLAHEIGTPLNVVSGRAELIAEGRLSTEETAKSAAAIRTQTQRIATTVRQLLDFARQAPPKRTDASLMELIEQTGELLRPIAEKQGVALRTSKGGAGPLGSETFPSDATARIDAAQIQQVLSNLVINAIQASSPRAVVTVVLAQDWAQPPPEVGGEEARFWKIKILDQGHGIEPEAIQQIFEPFYTTKDVGQGTGLGLSISYSIVREHSGWIQVHSSVGEGSEFVVFLPAEQPTNSESRKVN